LAPAAYDGNPAVKRRVNRKQIRVLFFLPLCSQNSDFKGASFASPLIEGEAGGKHIFQETLLQLRVWVWLGKSHHPNKLGIVPIHPTPFECVGILGNLSYFLH
jgi:hypothetical protein